MERQIYKQYFNDEKIPEWQCPTCEKGFLNIKKGSLISEELASSAKLHNDEYWEPFWIQLTYTCIFECTNINCKELVSSIGNITVDYFMVYGKDDFPDEKYYNKFVPLFFNPPLKLIKLFEGIPDSIKLILIESFKVAFCNPASSLNNIRIAIEAILNDKKIKRFNINKGKKIYINLHQRINLLSSKFDQLKEHILAVKWLGNSGSHDEKRITIDDVFDALELMEYILQEIYGKN